MMHARSRSYLCAIPSPVVRLDSQQRAEGARQATPPHKAAWRLKLLHVDDLALHPAPTPVYQQTQHDGHIALLGEDLRSRFGRHEAP